MPRTRRGAGCFEAISPHPKRPVFQHSSIRGPHAPAQRIVPRPSPAHRAPRPGTAESPTFRCNTPFPKVENEPNGLKRTVFPNTTRRHHPIKPSLLKKWLGNCIFPIRILEKRSFQAIPMPPGRKSFKIARLPKKTVVFKPRLPKHPRKRPHRTSPDDRGLTQHVLAPKDHRQVPRPPATHGGDIS